MTDEVSGPTRFLSRLGSPASALDLITGREPGPLRSGAAVSAFRAGVSAGNDCGVGHPSGGRDARFAGRRDACPTGGRFVGTRKGGRAQDADDSPLQLLAGDAGTVACPKLNKENDAAAQT